MDPSVFLYPDAALNQVSFFMQVFQQYEAKLDITYQVVRR